jgi:DNA replication protein DnaC
MAVGLSDSCANAIQRGVRSSFRAWPMRMDVQLSQPKLHDLSFDDRLDMLVDSEVSSRETRRITRLIRQAGFPLEATLEDLILRASRHIDKSQIAGLSTCDWVRKQQNIIIMGATGTGKSWLSSAFGTQACRQSLSVLCRRTVTLYDDITQAMVDGSLPKLKARLIRPKVHLTPAVATVLFDVFDSRLRSGSLILTSQFPVEKWHGFIPDPTLADAILDRIVHQAHKIHLKGDSLRKEIAKEGKPKDN